jgi:hypothetical protein
LFGECASAILWVFTGCPFVSRPCVGRAGAILPFDFSTTASCYRLPLMRWYLAIVGGLAFLCLFNAALLLVLALLGLPLPVGAV